VQGINSLQDLKTRLEIAGFEIMDYSGWYLNTAHGRWTMLFGQVYLNNVVINHMHDAPVIKKRKTRKLQS